MFGNVCVIVEYENLIWNLVVILDGLGDFFFLVGFLL